MTEVFRFLPPYGRNPNRQTQIGYCNQSESFDNVRDFPSCSTQKWSCDQNILDFNSEKYTNFTYLSETD